MSSDRQPQCPTRAAVVLFLVLLAPIVAGCATRSDKGAFHRPQAIARVTRDEVEPLRHPVESSTAYVERAVERLSARPNDYSVFAEQTEEGGEQLGHWWDALLGRPERKWYGESDRPALH